MARGLITFGDVSRSRGTREKVVRCDNTEEEEEEEEERLLNDNNGGFFVTTTTEAEAGTIDFDSIIPNGFLALTTNNGCFTFRSDSSDDGNSWIKSVKMDVILESFGMVSAVVQIRYSVVNRCQYL